MSGARVLYVLAHPDDEDPFTVTHLCRARGCAVTLFTLTRGEGGDNARGEQADEALGLLRTFELLEAGERYGVAEVLTASAFDYGYSRRLAEAEARWDAGVLAAELDAAIDRARPDLVVTHFDQDQEAEHAHHRYAGWLTRRVMAARRARGAATPRLLVGVPGPVALPISDAHRRLAREGYRRHATQGGEILLAMRTDLPRGFVDPDRPGEPRALSELIDPPDPVRASLASPTPAERDAHLAMRGDRTPAAPPTAREGAASTSTGTLTPTSLAGATSASWPLARLDDRAAMYRWRLPDHPLVALLPDAVAAANPIDAPRAIALPAGYPAYRGRAAPTLPSNVAVAPRGPIGVLSPGGVSGVFDQAIAGLTGPLPARLDRLTADALAGLAVVVVATRACRGLPAAARAGLLDFCRAGGHAIVLGQREDFDPARDAPYPGVLPRDAEEVCEEDSPVVLLADHPLLTTPHRLGAADFDGWAVQRGARFWSHWDAAYTPLIELCDPGRAPQRGAWLTAPVGRGHYTYCGLALHLQLPRAVVGAHRILANLVSL